jgi:hypothetical protein
MMFSQAEENCLASDLRRADIERMLALRLKYGLENEIETGDGWADGTDHRKPVKLSTEAQNVR